MGVGVGWGTPVAGLDDGEFATIEARELIGRAIDAADLVAVREVPWQISFSRVQRLALEQRGELLLAFLLFACDAFGIALLAFALFALLARAQRISPCQVGLVHAGGACCLLWLCRRIWLPRLLRF